MKATSDAAIADTIFWFNELDTAILDLFHEVVGIDGDLADAIIGDTRHADLLSAIRRVTELRGASEESNELRREVFKYVRLAGEYRNIIAHQPWVWQTAPYRLAFINSHAKKSTQQGATVYTFDELHAIRDYAMTLSSFVQRVLSPCLKGEPIPADDLLLETLRQKPGLPESPSQRNDRVLRSQRRPPR